MTVREISLYTRMSTINHSLILLATMPIPLLAVYLIMILHDLKARLTAVAITALLVITASVLA